MLKITVLYGHPTSPGDFEGYYGETHGPVVARMWGISRFELTRFIAGPDGRRPDYYRMAELYFENQEQMQASLASPEGQAVVADLANFATGGATILIGAVEE
jgi:uncharacterized protein (TIGR02118 family)